MSKASGSRSCPMCNDAGRHLFSTADLNRRISDRSFGYQRCDSCGTVFIDSIPENLGAYYRADYYAVPSSLDAFKATADADQFKLDVVTRFATRGRLLEIGPATGEFAYLASRAGFDVHAIEMDAACCAFLEQLGVQTVLSDNPGEVLDGMGRFDVIALWHVLEHIPRPLQLLEKLAGALTPDGVLTLALPNPESLQFRLFGRFWAHLDSPRHLHLIPLGVLERRAQELGLRTRWSTSSDPGALRCNRLGWIYSLRHLVDGRKPEPIYDLLGRFAERAAGPFERRGLNGSAYTVVLGKG